MKSYFTFEPESKQVLEPSYSTKLGTTIALTQRKRV